MHFSFADVNQEAVSRNCGSSLYFLKGGKEKLKSRKRQRENRRAKQREERIDKRNDYGIKDLTAYNAVLQIKTNGKANIVLRQHPAARRPQSQESHREVDRHRFKERKVCPENRHPPLL